MEDNRKKEKQLQDKLNNFLKNNDNTCDGEECLIKDPQEIVQREQKKIITNDGRQLLSEYTRY
jgi:hypothetical protein